MSDSDFMPEGMLVQVEMTVRVPVAATWDQIEKWLRFNLTQSGGLSLDNPLSSHAPEEWSQTFDVDSEGRVGVREEFDHKDNPDGGRSYRVRYREVSP